MLLHCLDYFLMKIQLASKLSFHGADRESMTKILFRKNQSNILTNNVNSLKTLIQ